MTKERIKLTLKMFYKWLYNTENYPDVIRWLKINRKLHMKLPEQMLNEDDIKKLILACKTSRDRAVIALLWDSGARVGEILGINLKSLVLSKIA